MGAGATVVVLSRSVNNHQNIPSGVATVPVDYTDATHLEKIFKDHNIEVLISTLPFSAFGLQTLLADAAKHASVKLFVPSTFTAAIGYNIGPLAIVDKVNGTSRA